MNNTTIESNPNITTMQFVSSILEKDFASAKSLFKQMFHQKSLEKLQDKKISVAKQMMGNLPG